MRINFLVLFLVLAISWRITNLFAGEVRAIGQTEWDKTVEAAKKEGKLVAGIPASAELRKSITESFKSRFPGIELELTTSRGPTNASKISAEHAAGVRYFDLLISGTSTPFNLLNAGILDPVEPLLILPEVKDPKRWFGGHIWLDNSKRFLYAFQAYQSQNFWYNSTLTKPEEIRSYDDLLNPKWKNQDRLPRPALCRRRNRNLGLFLEDQGRRLPEETSRPRHAVVARPKTARR